ncbi:MAG TPA: hypothetical protein ENH23_04040 [candidate division Zixibacteria bacterium]|nr:hypothetical protein [candidate division Zixibacteria bacterium]
MDIFLIVILFLLVLFYFIPKIRKGFKGALFGAEFIKKYGEVDVKYTGVFEQKISISQVKDSGVEKNGINFITVNKQFAYRHIQPRPYTVSREEAKKLIKLLSEAVSDT